MRYFDGLGPIGPSTISELGYQLMSAISSSPDLSLLVMNRPGFSRLVDPITLQMKTGIGLLEMITKRTRFVDPEFTLDNYKMATILSSTNIVSDLGYVLQSRPYERIYHFLYDEKNIQNNYFTETEIDKRKKIDVFSLSAVARHVG
jgi:hypothetical protein